MKERKGRTERVPRGFSYTIFIHPLYITTAAYVHHCTMPPATWWWRVGGSQREACTTRHPTPSPTESEPFHPRPGRRPAGGGGMPRPRLRFGITSTSSTSRLITLSAARRWWWVAEKRSWKWRPLRRRGRRGEGGRDAK